MSIIIKVIDSNEAFKDLETEWNKLYNDCARATIFSSWDWMYTWWEVFSQSTHSNLFILCVYDNQQLIGIAPFHICNAFPKSIIQGKTLYFIGSGEDIKDKIVSQYSDFIVTDEHQETMISSVSSYLEANKNKWDFADFQFLLEHSLVSRCFSETNASIITQLSVYGNRYFINEMDNFEFFLDKTGNRWRKMYAKKSRKLSNDGDSSISQNTDVASSLESYQQLIDMHKARWENRTDHNIFASELFNEFHIKLLERLVPKDKAYIKTLSLNDEPLASYYCFIDKSQLHYYQSGFYSKHANRYSPLFLLIYEEISQSINQNVLFDFMFDESPSSYKKEQYAAKSEPMYHLIWSTKKSRLSRYKFAKTVQTKYLNYKKQIADVKNKYKTLKK